jgi:predicted DNA-binding transcriptional regulator YafY
MKTEITETYQHRMNRLIELICEIKASPNQKPEQLYRSLGISRSQFHEDKKALAKSGFVFEYDRKQKRYVIKKDKYLPISDLSSFETLSLIMAVSQISTTGDPTLAFDAVKAIKKIIANSEKDVRELLEYAMDDVVLKSKFSVDSRIVEELWRAKERWIRLEIIYNDFSQKRERMMQIDPYAIYFRGRALYLDAFILEEKKVLTLRVSRVKQILRPLGNFKPRDDFNFRERHRHSFRVFTSEKPPELVRVKFVGKAARLIDETYHHESQRKLHYTDGSLILSLTVSDPREVLWYLVLPWGDEAEVLEPEWLREEAIRVAHQIVAKYQADK